MLFEKKRIVKPSLYIVAVLALLTIGLLVITNMHSASASPVVGFNPGNIIDEPTFTNTNSMTVNQIQAFLNSKVPTCDTQGTQTSEFGGGTRAQWATSRGYPPPYTCLKDYVENGYSAAQIIYNTAQTYQINPQVLIVLLQKEQGLVTDTWPTANQYKTATGYGCPDTAACSSTYFGFTNQVQWAAKMFHAILTSSPTWYTPYVLGTNFIQYNPNSSCGGTNVVIQNRATQALYNYTPYQPDPAALNAGYGTGDSCGAYGNRNFYLYFTDWFGSTTINSTFLRTVDNGTLYFVQGTNKYPISDINNFNALYPLGGVGFVSQSYLDSLTTGSTLGRIIKANDGTIYFYDAGIKLAFTSCTMVQAYGSSCGQAILMSDTQINALSTGPNMTSVYKTTSGKTFYLDGTKHEVYDTSALTTLGVSLSGANILNENALNNISLGAPILSSNQLVKSASGSVYIYAGNSVSRINDYLLAGSYLGNLNVTSLSNDSLAKLTSSTGTEGFVKSSDGTSYIIVEKGKEKITDTSDWNQSFTQVPDAVLAQIPTIGTVGSVNIIKSAYSGTVYVVVNGEKRPIASWGDLLALNPSASILTVPDYYINTLPTGVRILAPGQLVKSQNNGTVYMIDGLSNKITLSTFNPSNELGFTSLITVTDDVLNKYTTSLGTLNGLVTCGATQGLAISGSIYSLSITNGVYTQLSSATCNLLSIKSTPNFLLAPDGTIYKIQNGQKQAIRAYQTYANLVTPSSLTIKASTYDLSLIPTGVSL